MTGQLPLTIQRILAAESFMIIFSESVPRPQRSPVDFGESFWRAAPAAECHTMEARRHVVSLAASERPFV